MKIFTSLGKRGTVMITVDKPFFELLVNNMNFPATERSIMIKGKIIAGEIVRNIMVEGRIIAGGSIELRSPILPRKDGIMHRTFCQTAIYRKVNKASVLVGYKDQWILNLGTIGRDFQLSIEEMGGAWGMIEVESSWEGDVLTLQPPRERKPREYYGRITVPAHAVPAAPDVNAEDDIATVPAAAEPQEGQSEYDGLFLGTMPDGSMVDWQLNMGECMWLLGCLHEKGIHVNTRTRKD